MMYKHMFTLYECMNVQVFEFLTTVQIKYTVYAIFATVAIK